MDTPTAKKRTRPKTRAAQPPASSDPIAGGGEIRLNIPYGNKDAAQKLGARYRDGAWYVPAGLELSSFRNKGWL